MTFCWLQVSFQISISEADRHACRCFTFLFVHPLWYGSQKLLGFERGRILISSFHLSVDDSFRLEAFACQPQKLQL